MSAVTRAQAEKNLRKKYGSTWDMMEEGMKKALVDREYKKMVDAAKKERQTHSPEAVKETSKQVPTKTPQKTEPGKNTFVPTSGGRKPVPGTNQKPKTDTPSPEAVKETSRHVPTKPQKDPRDSGIEGDPRTLGSSIHAPLQDLIEPAESYALNRAPGGPTNKQGDVVSPEVTQARTQQAEDQQEADDGDGFTPPPEFMNPTNVNEGNQGGGSGGGGGGGSDSGGGGDDSGGSDTGGDSGSNTGQDDVGDADGTAGGGETQVLEGGDWFYERGAGDSQGFWFVRYQFPGLDGKYIFYQATPAEYKALFGTGKASSSAKKPAGWLKKQVANGTYIRGGWASEVFDPNGETFDQMFDRVVENSLGGFATGVSKTLMAKLAADPDIRRAMFLAEEFGWSQDRIWAEIHDNPIVVERYPHLKDIKDREGWSWREAISQIKAYEQTIISTFEQYGFDAPTQQEAQSLLAANKSGEMVALTLRQIAIYQQNPELFQHFAEIMAQVDPQLANDLNFLEDEDSILDFLSGQNIRAMEIYEMAQLSYTAEQAGLQDFFEAHEVVEFYGRGAGTDAFERWGGNLAVPLQNAAQTILPFRHDINLGRYDVSEDDIIDISVGLRPRSGRDPSKLREQLVRLSEEASKFQEQQATPLTRFDSNGVPQPVSLKKLREGLYSV